MIKSKDIEAMKEASGFELEMATTAITNTKPNTPLGC